MKFKISLSTYSLDIIEAFSALGNKKSQFIEQALVSFIGSKKGKDTLRLMARPEREIEHKTPKKEKTCSEQKGPVEQGTRRISIDSFLS